RPNYPRAMDVKTLAEKLKVFGVPVTAFDTVKAGVAEGICQAGKDGVVCAIGSLYFSGDIREAYFSL
ncbi:MAG: bifunctional folylpolyglutamate synthase/dihydrofolate synthase, partial [Oscillospiraceae bacterium]|nr:bifunctional folylpolyglutamate synthase/dihydrofolate synthase [Oscillospiraceae bacterium]